MIISPCISICRTDPKTGYCYGCGRSNDEKKIWKLENTSDEWKKKNEKELDNITVEIYRQMPDKTQNNIRNLKISQI